MTVDFWPASHPAVSSAFMFVRIYKRGTINYIELKVFRRFISRKIKIEVNLACLMCNCAPFETVDCLFLICTRQYPALGLDGGLFIHLEMKTSDDGNRSTCLALVLR